MGGINHQPCDRETLYLKHSTRMSRGLSEAHRALESANVALEDLLLAELNGQRGKISAISESLTLSEIKLEEMQGFMSGLRKAMEQAEFTDLPTLYTTDMEILGEKFINRDMVCRSAWQTVKGIMKSGGFYAMLDHLEEQGQELLFRTRVLAQAVEGLTMNADHGNVHMVVEENYPNNIKIEFARLYTRWNHFHSIFLASSMLSTELWYCDTRVGSLV